MAPTHMTGKSVPKEEWPHRAGSHRVPARLRDHSWRRWGRDGHRSGATSGVRIMHPKIANRGRSIRSSAANRLAARKATDLAIGSVQTVDRSKYRPAGPATAELSPIAAMTAVRRLVTERGLPTEEARGSAAMGAG
jgi:hypothetical protein